MGDQATNALVAIALGSVLAVLLLIPTAAVQYRLDGRLGPLDLAILVTSAVYALAIWTYTLLPMPVDGTFACKGSQLRVLGSLGLVHVPDSGGPLALLREPAFLQVVLNVLLFVPLGYFVRVILHRGVVVATALGLGLSLLVELTQRTGVWHLYDCAYRLFDVDDLLANTAGALLGTAVAPVLLLLGRPGADPDRDDARPVTVRRRAFGMACDLLAILLTGGGLSSVVSIGLAVAERDPASGVGVALLAAAPLVAPAAQLVLVLTTGRTLGEIVTRLRPEPRPSAGQRLVRWALGSGGWALASALSSTSAVAAAVAVVLAVGAVVGVWATRDRRGFANAVARLGVVDERT